MMIKTTKSKITGIKLSVVLLFLTLVSFSQSKNSPLFEEGSRICFVGNSITHQGGFHHNIMLYQTTRFPQDQVTFYNCGIGGNQAYNVLERMESDILVHNPTHAVIMLGMNDVNRNLYGTLTPDSDTLKRRKAAIDRYKRDMESIVSIFLSKSIQVVLQKPSIYDQTAAIPATNYFGVNDVLKECADFIQQLASKYNLQVIDYWTIMERLNKEIQKKHPSSTIVGKDRVHPGVTGHLIMAYQFLKTMQASGYVSKIVVDKDNSSDQCLNCDITGITNEKPGSLSFTVNEYALPFPVLESQEEGLSLVPFMNELNTELLQVSGFKRGQYQCKIDGIVIGNFSSQQLKKGINLAQFENTPQYIQSQNVLEKLQEMWKVEGILRNLSFIEFTEAYKSFTGDKNNLNEFHDYFLKKSSDKNGSINPWFKEVIEAYVKNKPKQKEYEDEFIRLKNKAYQLAQPVKHNFEINSLK